MCVNSLWIQALAGSSHVVLPSYINFCQIQSFFRIPRRLLQFGISIFWYNKEINSFLVPADVRLMTPSDIIAFTNLEGCVLDEPNYDRSAPELHHVYSRDMKTVSTERCVLHVAKILVKKTHYYCLDFS
jgi:hypothetical protein